MGKRKSPDLKINDLYPEFEAAEKAAKEGDFENAAEKGHAFFQRVAGVLGISLASLNGLLCHKR